MLRIFLVFTFLFLFISDEAKSASCFESCMRKETIPAICYSKCKESSSKTNQRVNKFKQHRSNAEYIQRVQQAEREKFRDMQKQSLRKKEMEKLIAEKEELSKDINLGCFSACMKNKNQDRYCENICIDKKLSADMEKIDTGDSSVDKMIVDCYKGCFKKSRISPSCLHSCCYICPKQKINQSTGVLQDSRSNLSLDCLDKCVSNGTQQNKCENICSGYYRTNTLNE